MTGLGRPTGVEPIGRSSRAPLPPRACMQALGPTAFSAPTCHCNKSPTYFGKPLLREFCLFFVSPKIFRLVYLQCFTMYIFNAAMN
jgi:hypothetical protein